MLADPGTMTLGDGGSVNASGVLNGGLTFDENAVHFGGEIESSPPFPSPFPSFSSPPPPYLGVSAPIVLFDVSRSLMLTFLRFISSSPPPSSPCLALCCGLCN